jgi:5,10-methylenetetrahydromethanopterin reductase
LGSWGEQTLRACAGLYQEIKIGGSANPALLPHYRRLLDGLAAEGKGLPTVGICIGAVCVVDEDAAAARALARREVALYLPVVAPLDPTVQVEPEHLARLKQAADRFDFDAAGALISDELLARFALAGSPSNLVDQTLALFASGANRVEYGTPHGLTPATGLQLLGQKVLPAVQRALR